jgi:serine/threonine protein kinase
MTGTIQGALGHARRSGLDAELVQSVPTRDAEGAQVRDGAGNLFFVKSASLSAEPSAGWGQAPAEGIIRESQVLRELEQPTDGLLVASGVDEEIAWIATRWLDGSSLRDWARSRTGQLDRRSFKEIAEAAAEALGQIHEAGYLHCDVQPAHLILTPSGIHLIDFELSRPKSDRDTPYNGALIHYCAPEVAKGMKERSSNIEVDELTDIYALGASLVMAATRHVPIDYGTEEQMSLPMDQKLDSIAQGRRFTFEKARIEAWPEMEQVLSWAMNPRRDERCRSVPDLVRVLHSVDT